MKLNKSLIWTVVLLIIVAALYRVIPGRPFGFIPQIAMGLFGGAVIKDKKWAFALPLFSMFLSDLLYQGLYMAGMTPISGFYDGQWVTYLLFAGITILGFTMKQVTVVKVLGYSLVAPTLYFLASNLFVWIQGGGYNRPKTFSGLMMCYTDGIPFYLNSIVGTLVFSTVLFGSYYLLQQRKVAPAVK